MKMKTMAKIKTKMMRRLLGAVLVTASLSGLPLAWANPAPADAGPAAGAKTGQAAPQTVPHAALQSPMRRELVERPASREDLQNLLKGGYVLYVRHGRTDNRRVDRVPTVDLNDCSTQRELSAEGRDQARLLGEALRRARLPLGEVRVSPMCRTMESAKLAFPKRKLVVDEGLQYTSNLTLQQKEPILANTRRWLSTPVPSGTNRLLVAHAPNLMDLTGHFPAEASVSIFRPLGNGNFEYVASIAFAAWGGLSGQGR